MPLKELTKSTMESFQRLVDKFAVLVDLDSGGNTLAAESAIAVIAVMAGTITVLLEGRIEAGVIQKAVEALKPFRSRRVTGANLAREYSGDISIPDRRVCIGPAERAKRNEMADQLHLYSCYMTPVEWALSEICKCPTEERTIENLRAAFLRNVDNYNIVTCGPETLDLASDFGIEYVPR